MTTSLDFAIVANNADVVTISVLDQNSAPVILTGQYIRWQLFDPDGNALITKDTSSGIAIVNSSLGVANAMAIAINPADTIGIAQGNYVHEAVAVANSSSPVTITANDPILSAGSAFIRQQYTGWP